MAKAATPTRLFFVRHGKVHNPEELAYGHLPRFQLGDEGREQARRAAEWLAGQGIDGIVSSPLLRAKQTAAIIRSETGPVPLHTSIRLRESELARFWQGLAWQQIAVEHPELYAAFESAPGSIETGESMAAMSRRMMAAARFAARCYPGGTVALVSHRDPIVALRLALERRSFDELNQTRCQTGSITEVWLRRGSLEFESYVEP